MDRIERCDQIVLSLFVEEGQIFGGESNVLRISGFSPAGRFGNRIFAKILTGESTLRIAFRHRNQGMAFSATCIQDFYSCLHLFVAAFNQWQ